MSMNTKGSSMERGSLNEEFGKDVYRKGNSVKGSDSVNEPLDSEN